MLSRKSLLVVDDERDMLDCVAEVLSPHFQLTLAGSSSEALRRLRERHFDAVVLDLKMDGDGQDGFDVLRYLSQQQSETRVLIASGLPRLDLVAQRYGAIDWLAKPYHIDVLEERVARLLGEQTGPH